MKYPVFAWRDVIQGFGAPQLFLNEEIAKRDFGYRINLEDSPMQYKPSDYELYRIGDYETDTGRMQPLDVPVFLINGMSVFGVNEK